MLRVPRLEFDVKNEILDFLDDVLLNNFVQPYSGANYECFFCGKNPAKGHDDDCKTVQYVKIREEIVKLQNRAS